MPKPSDRSLKACDGYYSELRRSLDVRWQLCYIARVAGRSWDYAGVLSHSGAVAWSRVGYSKESG